MVQVQNNLPETSRVWVYQSNRKFTDAEIAELENELAQFNSNWRLMEQN